MSAPTTGTAYKLADAAEWRAAQATGAYDGSPADRADGFIHLSTARQLPGTALKHYAGRSGLILAAVDLDALKSLVGDALRWEPSRGGDLFPHIYAPLPLSVTGPARALEVGADGAPRFADGATVWPEDDAA